ncbi:MAG: hypothetical protein IPN01_28210 [Deltaproteobacteria bacterium]|nr:hypothetical protein [Deltaproteobacteria bacterium]
MGSRALLVLSLALFVACSGGSRDKAPEEAAKPSPSEQDAMMPPPAFPPLPGWLAFTVQERETRQNPWTPVHPNAKIVVFNPAGWDELNENTPFTALSAQGPLRVIYSELSYIPFGCDDNPTQMVAFQGGYDFAEEAIWLLPEGREGGKSLGVTAGARDGGSPRVEGRRLHDHRRAHRAQTRQPAHRPPRPRRLQPALREADHRRRRRLADRPQRRLRGGPARAHRRLHLGRGHAAGARAQDLWLRGRRLLGVHHRRLPRRHGR